MRSTSPIPSRELRSTTRANRIMLPILQPCGTKSSLRCAAMRLSLIYKTWISWSWLWIGNPSRWRRDSHFHMANRSRCCIPVHCIVDFNPVTHGKVDLQGSTMAAGIVSCIADCQSAFWNLCRGGQTHSCSYLSSNAEYATREYPQSMDRTVDGSASSIRSEADVFR